MTAAMPMPEPGDAPSTREDAMGKVSAVLLNLEHTIARAKKGLIKVRKAGGDANVELALQVAFTELAKQHKRLMQDTYYAGDAIRLL
jgi:hypothetical protein